MNFNAKFQQTVICILTIIMVAFLIFYGYLPKSYNFKAGSVSSIDVYAPRDFVDKEATEQNAKIIANDTVKDIYSRSDELSADNTKRVVAFFDIVSECRLERHDELGTVNLYEDNDIIVFIQDRCSSELGLSVDYDLANSLVVLSPSQFLFVKDKAVLVSEDMMSQEVSDDDFDSILNATADNYVDTESLNGNLLDTVKKTLSFLLTQNLEYNSEATENARNQVYEAMLNDSVIVKKGTKIVSVGDTIDNKTYDLLYELELIHTDGIDFLFFVRAVTYVIMIFIVTFIYLRICDNQKLRSMRVFYTIIVAYIAPIVAAVYFAKISSSIALVLFFTTIAATYIGLNISILLSLSNVLLVWPIYGFAPEFLLVSITGIVVTSAIAGRKDKKYNSASLILIPTLFCVLTSVSYWFISAEPNSQLINATVWPALSAMLSIVAAIGFMPIYELFSNAVSPVRLIELSQPAHPLLKRLFLEASGTYQHCMMVANLSDAAAEAIGADTLLCKVASYYHDIGKLENPNFFTENQFDGYNPHNDMSVEQSVSVITSHTSDGVKLAKKYKLPTPIINIINEHHGNSYPAYFYFKAKEAAEANGLPAPNVDDFRYKGRVPSTKESAIVMIADTCEAAIKSKKSSNITEVEETIRKLIKSKIEQDQLINSQLSFDDLEKITLAFKQVYSGVYHERIAYPDDNKKNK